MKRLVIYVHETDVLTKIIKSKGLICQKPSKIELYKTYKKI